ncbi:hypothetical protein DICPUDRAFT_154762 [Dictyostelium purpureum]|uniref:AIG1-type G domain-containing protein n=1 Tax=Dictyostelium purpureum TaxID=5786 RepID=F0ZS70_DICPU|nr:uncharacterized protein DICPUDRAFT_154762 [Dictyostelium purpureum]EGC33226.1 hypothetical protein DICPUDRAFT_154762 [Dictyostelium purpureum]|eukprot:XP_003290266.1 hypothetical protein DICPUDRAFT_154762 [Dictyostelium purpureum]
MSNTFSILVIGETGSGKSTLINTITNYFLGGKIPDNIKVAIKTKFFDATENFKSNENDSHDRTKSQTDSCNTYSFKKDSKTFVFIDTPGLSDTRGVEQDDINIGKIIDSAENCLNLSAVLIVINGSVPRMTINLQNVITRLRGSIPDSLLNNIFLVFTNCYKFERNFVIESLEIEVNTDNIFHMNNNAFSSDKRLWDEDSIDALKKEFERSFITTERLLETVSKLSSVSTKHFGEMKKHRMIIKSTLHKAKVDIGNLQMLQDSLASYQAQLKKANNDVESFKNYTKKTTVATYELKDAHYHSTICSTCNHVCHDNCRLSEISTMGDNAFLGCYAMSGCNNCGICPSKCSYTVHYHDKKTMVSVEKTVEEELKDLKDKFMKSSQLSTQYSGQISTLSDAKKLADETLKKMTTEIVYSCKELKKLCSGFNLVDELQITLTQMEMEAKNSTSFDARKSADEMIRVIREICNTLNKESVLKSKKKNISIDESKIKKDYIKNNNFAQDNICSDSKFGPEGAKINPKNMNNPKVGFSPQKGTNMNMNKFPPQMGMSMNMNMNKYPSQMGINMNKNKYTPNKIKIATGSQYQQPQMHQMQKSNGIDVATRVPFNKQKKKNCISCKKDFYLDNEKYKELKIKHGKNIQCTICFTATAQKIFLPDPNSGIKQKKINCVSCKNDFILDNEKYKELKIKHGPNIQCKTCFTTMAQKIFSPDINNNKQKKLICISCKNDFNLDYEKYKELKIKHGNNIQCSICFTATAQKIFLPDPNSGIKQKKLICISCKNNFNLDNEKYKELKIKHGPNIQCKTCFTTMAQKILSPEQQKKKFSTQK